MGYPEDHFTKPLSVDEKRLARSRDIGHDEARLQPKNLVDDVLHRSRGVPECIENMLRPAVQRLVDQMELGTSEARPTPEFWEQLDKRKFVKESIDRHNREGESNH